MFPSTASTKDENDDISLSSHTETRKISDIFRITSEIFWEKLVKIEKKKKTHKFWHLSHKFCRKILDFSNRIFIKSWLLKIQIYSRIFMKCFWKRCSQKCSRNFSRKTEHNCEINWKINLRNFLEKGSVLKVKAFQQKKPRNFKIFSITFLRFI